MDIEEYDSSSESGTSSIVAALPTTLVVMMLNHPSQVLGYKNKTSSLFNIMDRFLKKGWTDEEVKLATGNAKSYMAVHPLKLNSSYATVKGFEETWDSSGEPLATSYHAKFLGIVDYLWYSNGLSPTKVLDTLPINSLRRTGGLPCKKIGSYHLALVSEFAYTKRNSKDNTDTFSTVSDVEVEQHRPTQGESN